MPPVLQRILAPDYLVHEYAGVPCTHYFDDFTIIVPEVIGDDSDDMVGRFLKELGWEVKRNKDEPTASSFAALGVEIVLGKFSARTRG